LKKSCNEPYNLADKSKNESGILEILKMYTFISKILYTMLDLTYKSKSIPEKQPCFDRNPKLVS
jgi:hypothetical protein